MNKDGKGIIRTGNKGSQQVLFISMTAGYLVGYDGFKTGKTLAIFGLIRVWHQGQKQRIVETII